MDALKQQLLKVQQQLAGLSASQKMLTASLLVIMVMTLFYWSRFASTSEMEPVVDKTLSAEETRNVRDAVAAEGIQTEERDGRVYAPASKRPQVVAAMSKLAFNNKMPVAFATDAAAKSSSANILESPSDRAQRQRDMVNARLSEIIGRFPNVTGATVMIAGEKRGGRLNPENPTATVSIDMDADPKLVKQTADAARNLVVHAQPGMSAADVGITVNGRAVKTDEEDAFGGDGVLGRRKEAEDYFSKSVKNRLRYIDKLAVTVSVKLDINTTSTTERIVDPKNKVEALRSNRTSSDENVRPAIGREPGMTANVGETDNASASAQQTSNSEKNESNYDTAIGFKNVATSTPAGNCLPQTASVGVPMSYYRGVWQILHPKATAEPTPEDLDKLIAREEIKIRDSVRNTLMINDDKAVSVATYYDLDSLTPETATAGLALPATGGFGAKEIAIGALAVVSLFMVSMMVKKSAPQPVVIAPSSTAMPVPEQAAGLLSQLNLAGEVAEADLTMTGQELSDEAIEARQVIEQVGTMVKSNPEQAAALVKRWLNQD